MYGAAGYDQQQRAAGGNMGGGVVNAIGNLAGKRAMDIGKQIGNQLTQLQQILEGPNALRGVSAIAGLVLSAGTLWSIRHVYRDLVNDPPQLILKAYTILFGLIIFGNEVKSSASPRLDALRSWVFKWCPFMSVVAGKGLFLLLVGSIGTAFHTDIEVWSPAVAVALCGLCYILTYYAKKNELDQAAEESMYLHASNFYYAPVDKC